jgi:hypothetical protein
VDTTTTICADATSGARIYASERATSKYVRWDSLAGANALLAKHKSYCPDVRIRITCQDQVDAFAAIGIAVAVGDTVVMEAKCLGAWPHRVKTDSAGNDTYSPAIDCLKLSEGHAHRSVSVLFNFHKFALAVLVVDKRPDATAVFRVVSIFSFPKPTEGFLATKPNVAAEKARITKERRETIQACLDEVAALSLATTRSKSSWTLVHTARGMQRRLASATFMPTAQRLRQ